jgi:hypothetical protein
MPAQVVPHHGGETGIVVDEQQAGVHGREIVGG